ncbi:hypothetical protein [Streptomyces sp. NPDC054804]
MSEIEREVHARVQAAADKEIHVSTVWSPDEYPAGLCAEVHEYSPSTETFGRGITFPLNRLHGVMEGLESIWFQPRGRGSGRSDGSEP